MKRPVRIILGLSVFWVLFSTSLGAAAIFCDAGEDQCWQARSGLSSSSPASPTSDSKVKLNPSAVPIEKGLGIGTITYDGKFDFAIVRGLGRVGAAISPSASEETFFGAPGFENPLDYSQRKFEQKRFEGRKINLATAFGLFNNKKRGMKRFELNLGVMGRYNQDTKGVYPGGGVSGVIGPITYGYSRSKDESQIDLTSLGDETKPRIQYDVETISGGIFLNSLAVDYSVLRLLTEDVITVKMLTGTLFISRLMVTVAHRTEESNRPKYDFETESLVDERVSSALFGGVQVNAARFLMLGAFYNYYLVNDVSVGATLFF